MGNDVKPRKVDKRAVKKRRALLAGSHNIKKTQEQKAAALRDQLGRAIAAPPSSSTRRADSRSTAWYVDHSFQLQTAVNGVADAAAAISGTTRWASIGEGGNLHVVNEGDAGAEHNFGLVAAERMLAPSGEWWQAAKRQRLAFGWSDGNGKHGLSAECLRSIVRYDGDMISELELQRRKDAGCELQHVKLSRMQCGNEQLAKDFTHFAIDGEPERTKILRWYVRSRGKPGRSRLLARCHPGCLSQSSEGNGKPTMRPVIDGQRMFLVPLRDIAAGEPVTHKYNTAPLEARVAGVRGSRV